MKDIHARVPVDAVAARVVSTGEHYDPGLRIAQKIARECSDLPIPTRPVQVPGGGQFIDFTGHTVGRLTVVGLSVEMKTGSRGQVKWVCRCVCGRYCIRSTKALKSGHDDSNECAHCYHVSLLKKRGSFSTR